MKSDLWFSVLKLDSGTRQLNVCPHWCIPVHFNSPHVLCIHWMNQWDKKVYADPSYHKVENHWCKTIRSWRITGHFLWYQWLFPQIAWMSECTSFTIWDLFCEVFLFSLVKKKTPKKTPHSYSERKRHRGHRVNPWGCKQLYLNQLHTCNVADVKASLWVHIQGFVHSTFVHLITLCILDMSNQPFLLII